jgi:hypothetical protein
MSELEAHFATLRMTVPIRLLNILMPVIPEFVDDYAKPLM